MISALVFNHGANIQSSFNSSERSSALPLTGFDHHLEVHFVVDFVNVRLTLISNIFVLSCSSSALLNRYLITLVWLCYGIAMPATEVETPRVSYCALMCLLLTLTIASLDFQTDVLYGAVLAIGEKLL